ncbi:MAG: translocation/assembly module TamB domain-containing protein, partial [Burkholderiaceae bacterium]
MRRIFLLAFWWVELPLLVVGALLVLFWIWSGTDQSLGSALTQAARYLPAGQTLQSENVSGSLRHGGHIGRLRWESNGLVVEARDVDLQWQPLRLLRRRLQLDTVHIAQLSIEDHSPSSVDGASAAPQEVVLPFEVDVDFGVDKVHWAGPPAIDARMLKGHYRYDQRQHALKLDSLLFAAGSYNAQATLEARAPMTLDLQVQGQVSAPIGDKEIALNAAASARGPLSGPRPLLDLVARVSPQTRLAAKGMEATVTAQVNPWAVQPVQQAKAKFTQFNLALLLPEAPQTTLSGTAQVQAQGAGWLAQIDAINASAGPWDKGRLPVDKLSTKVLYAEQRWTIEALDAQAGGGRITAQGKLGQVDALAALSGWQGQAQLKAVDPSRLHSAMAPARLDGELKASAAKGALTFDAWLQPAGPQPAASPLQGLRLQRVSAKGQWAKDTIDLQALEVRTDDARVQGQVSVHLANKAGRGNLQLTLPGADAQLNGSVGPKDGVGDLSLRVADVGKVMRWLGRLPYLPKQVADIDLKGQATVDLHWQGGWQQFLNGAGGEPSMRAKMVAPQLTWTQTGEPPAQAIRLSDFQAEIAGPANALALKAQGQVRQGNLRAELRLRALGGREIGGAWQATLDQLRAQVQDSLRPGPWVLVLGQPTRLQWKPAASSLLVSAGEANLSGPAPGTATLAWQPVRWSYGANPELVSKGQLRSLSMAWMELLAGTSLGELGLSGDLVFDADWDIAAAETLKLHAALVRRSGDLRVLAEGSQPAAGSASTAPRPIIDAGVKDARVTLDSDGRQLRLGVSWDSARAGNAQADITTSVQHATGGWSWPADSTLRGSIHAQLPQVGVWSVLAPPGWRVRGTLDANLVVAGTRAAPQWSGTLQADDLALRSVVDGIEFGNGRLRTRVHGQRLDITEFSLQGAGGAAGGELRATGFAEWLPDGSGANPALSKVRIQIGAVAKALRLSSRADRRLTVSGTLQANLNNAQLAIRGALKADQALFILPDETTPTLGSDVVIKGASSAARIQPTSASTPTTAPAPADSEPGTRVRPDLQLTFDLGQDFQLQGRGLSTRLAGTLKLISNADTNYALRLTGVVSTVGGTFKAYGQNLVIE